MRILVFSDSHGSTYRMREAINLHTEADMIIHLGDGERDIDLLRDEIGNRKVVQVCGNCDIYSLLPYNELVSVSGIKIFCSHGHNEYVKHGISHFVEKAKSTGAAIALYGHTHESVTAYDGGLHIMNPGSIAKGEYGAIDITPQGIMLLPMKI